jgi:hypothetical protein
MLKYGLALSPISLLLLFDNLLYFEEDYFCQGFTKLHSGLGPNGLWLQGLKEYSDSYLISNYLRPILGSKCLVTQTMGNYLRLSRAGTFRGDLGEDISGCHPDF